ncbi:DUF1513 domain-containing protein [Marinomonas algicola]|uniref:DUF1513 domain-containing protein n=1 Tax=Marinomonas algicola TaxID=2773454 RepID=UPI001748CC54|nr:DUF1513 domain-containing protein [Marinomonas algicola]
MDRRSFLRYTALNIPLFSASSTTLWSTNAFATDQTNYHLSDAHLDHFASAYTGEGNKHHLALVGSQGEPIWEQALDSRAHAPVFHPSKPIVAVVARRPGFYIDLYDTKSGKKLIQMPPSEGHHFYGHGVFSADGKYFITQENHYDSGEGKVFVRDWQNGRIVHEWLSYGIGPHQSCLLNDTTLVVANGGLKTHPNNDRKIENIDSMQPNVSFISLQDGHLLHQVTHPAEYHQLSIRHLHINKIGQVAIAFQYQGPKWDTVPLVGLTSLESSKIDYLPMPEPIRQRFKQYCGSVRFDASGKVLAVTTPRGGMIAFWSIEHQDFLSNNTLMDVCGLKATSQPFEFIVSTGRGKIFKINTMENIVQLVQKNDKIQWDNHLT